MSLHTSSFLRRAPSSSECGSSTLPTFIRRVLVVGSVALARRRRKRLGKRINTEELLDELDRERVGDKDAAEGHNDEIEGGGGGDGPLQGAAEVEKRSRPESRMGLSLVEGPTGRREQREEPESNADVGDTAEHGAEKERAKGYSVVRSYAAVEQDAVVMAVRNAVAAARAVREDGGRASSVGKGGAGGAEDDGMRRRGREEQRLVPGELCEIGGVGVDARLAARSPHEAPGVRGQIERGDGGVRHAKGSDVAPGLDTSVEASAITQARVKGI